MLAFVIYLAFSLTNAEWTYNSTPNPASAVTAGRARFTVLTEHLIRMEYGRFIDAPMFVFLNRNLPTPKYTSSTKNDLLTIQTESVVLQYQVASLVSFNQYNLNVSIMLGEKTITWSPQPTANRTDAGGNLFGTFEMLGGETADWTKKLNCYAPGKPSYCELGLVSRDDFAVIDDTNRVRLVGLG